MAGPEKLDLILEHLGLALPDDCKRSDACRELAERGEKIAAIKAYREATGASLREAKEAIESYMGRA